VFVDLDAAQFESGEEVVEIVSEVGLDGVLFAHGSFTGDDPVKFGIIILNFGSSLILQFENSIIDTTTNRILKILRNASIAFM
jgi:hypothetical protein